MHFTLTDLVVDIAQNACQSGAKLVELEVKENDQEFSFLVRDDGKGMTPEEIDMAVDPFLDDGEKHPHRKLGLGIPLLIQTAQQSGGGWDTQSKKGQGTTAKAWFDMKNVDTPPIGDLPDTFRTVLMFEGPQDIVIRRSLQADGKEPVNYEVRKSQIVATLGNLNEVGTLILLGKYLNSLEDPDEYDE